MNDLINGILLVLNVKSILMMTLGAILGVVVGAIPGLTGTMAIALVLPITLYVSPWMGIPLILGIYKASGWSGSVGSILLGTPGNAAAAAMVLDGYPMKQQGKGMKALKASLVCGVFADFGSDVITILVCAPLATLALMFGPPEFMLLIIMALMVIASVGAGSFWKAVIAAALGLFFSLVGMDPVLSTPRLTFGMYQLLSGINLVPLLIGAFAFSEMIQKMMNMTEDSAVIKTSLNPSEIKENNSYTFREFRATFKSVVRSTLIGTWIGLLPGIGSGVSPWVGYSAAKRSSKHPEEFGKGSLEGLVAAQAASNSVAGANLIPLLSLGIPGDTTAALLIGVMMAHGLIPGPLIFDRTPDAVYAIFATLIICDLVYLLVGLVTCRVCGNITMVRNSVLVPIVTVLCVIGTYAYNKSIFDVFVMVFFGLLGFAMKRNGVNVPIFVIAFILGSMFETNFRQSLVLLDGNLLAALGRPVSAVCALMIVGMVISNLYRFYKERKKNAA